ncbi:HRDC domain-containing protein [Flavisericum labens]
MCETLPSNKAELLELNGMGKTRVKKYVSKILKLLGPILMKIILKH